MGESKKKYVSVCLPRLQTDPDAAAASQKRRGASCQGFALVELIITFFIMATLAAIAVPLSTDYIHRAKVVRAIAEIRGIEKEIILFYTEYDTYPGSPPGNLETLQEIGRDNVPDPWGSPYQYRNLAEGPKTGTGKPKFCRRDRSFNPLNYDFDLYSVGPDRQIPTQDQITASRGADDIVRAANGRYVGEGAKF